jgi:alginate O-acetyltransferase complex protein AlgI
VFFRADSLDAAGVMLAGMAGLHGAALPAIWTEEARAQVAWIAACLAIVWGAPNTQQILGRYRVALDTPSPAGAGAMWWQWHPARGWLFVTVAAAMTALLSLTGISEFIYFRF